MEATSSIFSLKAVIILSILSIVLLPCVSAENLNVGGSSGWSLLSNMTEWSTSTSFVVNDSLAFLYTPDHDVIEVNEADFTTCRINNPIATYNDGETLILLSQPGTRYFVCGRSYHCEMGLKLRVNTLEPQAPPSPISQPNGTGLNTTIGPNNNYNGGNQTSQGPFNGCNRLDVMDFGSSLLHLGISFMALLNHIM